MTINVDMPCIGLAPVISQTAGLSRVELVELWIKVYGTQPPKGIKRGLLERSHAYHRQVRRPGGLRTTTRKTLLAIAEGKLIEHRTSKRELKQGTRLVREWHGVNYQVEVLEAGFLWNGQHFVSLSAVALAITGAKWSGPRFFGL